MNTKILWNSIYKKANRISNNIVQKHETSQMKTAA